MSTATVTDVKDSTMEEVTVLVPPAPEETYSPEMNKLVDAAVRFAREQGYCGEFDQIMTRAFGQPIGGRWLDSDGLDRAGYDRDGFKNGYDVDGFDREGYSRRGFDRDGYDRTGVNELGVNRDRIHTPSGLSIDSPEYRERFRFDSRGYDISGFDRNGRNRDGYTREQMMSSYRFDADGYDAGGRDRYGDRRPELVEEDDTCPDCDCLPCEC